MFLRRGTAMPKKKKKETSFPYVDSTKMYKDDRFFGPVYHKVKSGQVLGF